MNATPTEIAEVIIWRPNLAAETAKLAAEYRRNGNPETAGAYEAGIRLAADLLILRASREAA